MNTGSVSVALEEKIGLGDIDCFFEIIDLRNPPNETDLRKKYDQPVQSPVLHDRRTDKYRTGRFLDQFIDGLFQFGAGANHIRLIVNRHPGKQRIDSQTRNEYL